MKNVSIGDEYIEREHEDTLNKKILAVLAALSPLVSSANIEAEKRERS